MADITRWDPFAEMATLRNTIDRMFDDVRPFRAFGNGGGTPDLYFPIDVYETDEEVVLKASLPGVKPEDIDISVTGQVLTLKASAEAESEEKAQNWYRRERRQGTWVRQVTLPTDVSSDKAEANVEHGVLRLTLPKAESARPQSIKVSTQPVLEASKN
jgi:HSP20 family protein